MGYTQVVIDDASFLAENTLSLVQGRGIKNFKLWDAVRAIMFDFREKARYLGLTVAMNAWEVSAKLKDTTPKDREGNVRAGVDENTFSKVRGGPKFPMDLAESIPALCDNVFHALPPPENATGNRWKGVYITRGDEDWVGKDRDAVAPVRAPMNLAEILRLAEYDIPFAQEAFGPEVERIASLLRDPKDDVKLMEAEYKELLKYVTPQNASWVCRDAYDRVTLRRAIDKRQSTFF
jgi:hypothetical protein